MSSTPYKQELPPPGGFGRVHYERVPHKSMISGKTIALAMGISYTIGFLAVKQAAKDRIRDQRETKSAQNALQPFLLAERDRTLLKQMRKNRDYEAELMKDVEGWEVGTLYGTPVYNTVAENDWVPPSPDSYYAHNDPAEFLPYMKHELWV